MVTELRPGMLVGRYRLTERIAQGGMGSVWAARDERLVRDVAVKLLPRLLVTDPSAERRFEREARAMGRLQHPNVVSIFDVGTADPGTGEELPFIVMEFISGRSLNKMIEEGPLRPREAAAIMAQVARALTAAHRAGVIHRDLKPSNVMVNADGHVKVLDFGLARVGQQEGQAPEDTLTTPGMVLGSCPYMAPEQALGQKVGPRSDLFSCGAVLYEALTGRRAFDGSTPMRVLQAVVRCEYEPLEELAPDLPPALIEVVRRCLRREPEERYETSAELAEILEAVAKADDSQVTQALRAPGWSVADCAARRRVTSRWLAAVGVVAVLAVAGGYMAGRGDNEPSHPGAWQVREVFRYAGMLRHPSFSPTGSELALDRRAGSTSEIVVVSSSEGEELRTLARARPGEAIGLPRYSPDGRAVLIAATHPQRRSLRVLPAVGGATLAEIGDAIAGSWIDSGRIAFARATERGGQLWEYDLNRGEERLLRDPEGELSWWGGVARPGGGLALLAGPTEAQSGVCFLRSPQGRIEQWFPPGRSIYGMSWAPSGRALIASLDGQLVRIDSRGGEPLLPRFEELWDPSFSSDGRYVAVVRQEMVNDLIAVKPAGDGWSCVLCGVPETGFGSVAADGSIAFRRLVGGTSRVFVRSSEGRVAALTGPGDNASCPVFSPDGSRIAYLSEENASIALRIVPRDGGESVLLATDLEGSEYPSWAPDGQALAYAAGRPVSVWVVSTSGGEPRQLTPDGGDYPDWSCDPEGKWIAYVVWTEPGDPRRGAWVVPSGGGEPVHVSPYPTRVLWRSDGHALLQLRRSRGDIELWEGEPRRWSWRRMSTLNLGDDGDPQMEYLPLTRDPSSGDLIMNRRRSSGTLLIVEGVGGQHW